MPIDQREIYRLVRAQNKADRAAVDAILNEFFQKKEDGWHHEGCDETLVKYAESQVGSEEKKEHDKERQRRARERRKALFDTLRTHDLVPPWDTKTVELEAMLSRVTGSDESHTCHADSHATVTPPVTRDNTATHGIDTQPQPQPQSPTPVKKKKGAKAPLSAELPTWMQSLIDMYHEVLPELPGCRVMDEARVKALTDFWEWVLHSHRPDGTPRATNADEAISWTRDYLTRARNNDFIMGRGHRSPEHANWRCSIEYLLSTRGMKKVIEETMEPA